ncbi:MAG: arsenite efflux transporter metallochaperone ArsD [Candidatus Obscuribacterales bacterium]|nr:arsenite efflux transporter metallochaperone ArsD [Candidatus Obscuribacterales bacterium]
MKIQIFDPPMCCSTGICGPGVDPALVEFTADLDWLKHQGIAVERYNLSQQTQAFVNNATVSDALKKDGNDCLPLILVEGKIVIKGAYPKRDKLAELAGLEISNIAPTSALKFTVEQSASVDSGCCSPSSAVDQENCCDEKSEKKSDKKSCC